MGGRPTVATRNLTLHRASATLAETFSARVGQRYIGLDHRARKTGARKKKRKKKCKTRDREKGYGL